MLERQNGRCAYSRVPLEICLPNSHWRMSVERLNNRKGYTPENCVLVAGEFNTGDFSCSRGVKADRVKGSAQWSPFKVEAVSYLRHQSIDIELLEQDISKAQLLPCFKDSPVFPYKGLVVDQDNPIQCAACGMALSAEKFTRSERVHGHRCRTCMQKMDNLRRSTLRGHVQKCLCSARGRAKRRGQECSLTFLQVLNMLKQQRGHCYYSGIPLEYKQLHTDWRLSIERLNNSVGYTKENCVLVAIEFNTADHSRNVAVQEVFGTAQWSREKVKHIWGDNGCATKLYGSDNPRLAEATCM
eukprot:Skav210412  [mRNA]  locus=scaffold1573:5601:6497:- [translate_table: standard]